MLSTIYGTEWLMCCMTLNCVGLTQSSALRIIHRNAGLKCFFSSLVFANVYISQGSAETHLPCGGIYNNHAIANCLQSVPVKEF